MRMAIEVFTMVIVITIACIMFSSMISLTAQEADARSYYNIVRNRIEDSNYNKDVISLCQNEAIERGYQLEIEDFTMDTRNPSYLLRLRYSLILPVNKLVKNSENKEGMIEGYAR